MPFGLSARRRSDSDRFPHQIEDDVVSPLPVGEVLAAVVDDVVGTERPNHLQVACAADAGHLRAQGLRDLDSEVSDAARCAIDQDRLAPLDPAVVAETLQRGDRGQGHGRSLFEGQVGRHRRQGPRRRTLEFGEGARVLAVGLERLRDA